MTIATAIATLASCGGGTSTTQSNADSTAAEEPSLNPAALAGDYALIDITYENAPIESGTVEWSKAVLHMTINSENVAAIDDYGENGGYVFDSAAMKVSKTVTGQDGTEVVSAAFSVDGDKIVMNGRFWGDEKAQYIWAKTDHHWYTPADAEQKTALPGRYEQIRTIALASADGGEPDSDSVAAIAARHPYSLTVNSDLTGTMTQGTGFGIVMMPDKMMITDSAGNALSWYCFDGAELVLFFRSGAIVMQKAG